MFWFTADEHYNHIKILDYCKRPFTSIEQMSETIISNHNKLVGKDDVTIHAGDFGWFKKQEDAAKVYKRLKGNHIFLKGSHDRWLPENSKIMWRRHIDGQFVVVCHYAFRTWERAHYGSWNLHGHSHGTLPPIGRQYDIGVDCNNFEPVSFEFLRSIMDNIPILHSPSHDFIKD